MHPARSFLLSQFPRARVSEVLPPTCRPRSESGDLRRSSDVRRRSPRCRLRESPTCPATGGVPAAFTACLLSRPCCGRRCATQCRDGVVRPPRCLDACKPPRLPAGTARDSSRMFFIAYRCIEPTLIAQVHERRCVTSWSCTAPTARAAREQQPWSACSKACPTKRRDAQDRRGRPARDLHRRRDGSQPAAMFRAVTRRSSPRRDLSAEQPCRRDRRRAKATGETESGTTSRVLSCAAPAARP